MTRVLLLSNADRLSHKVAFCLRAAGMELDMLASSWAPYAVSRHVRKFSTAPFPSGNAADPEFTGLINHYIAANGIDCVLAGDIESLLVLSSLKPHLKDAACFPICSRETIDLLNDKFRFNQFLKANGLPAPQAILLRHEDDVFGEEFRSLPFPVIAKPLNERAGRGVIRADTYDQLVDHVYGGNPYSATPMMIQNFQPGLDGGCSVLAQDGETLIWAQQIYQRDGTIKFYQDEELLDVVRTAVKLTNLSGVANFDVRVDQDQKLLGIIECNPRFWYSVPAAAAHGLNFVEAGIKLALGEIPDGSWQSNYRHGIYYPFRAAVRHGAGTLFTPGTGIGRANFHELVRETVDVIPALYTVIAEKTGRYSNR